MKILAFATSNSSQSINRQLVKYACTLIDTAIIEELNINDYEMPIYSFDREKHSGVPSVARTFYEKIGDADGLLISLAEHNGSYPAAFKNLYDWASRIDAKVYQGEPMILLSTSPGPGGASDILAAAKKSAPFFGGEVLADLSIPRFYDNFNSEQARLSNVDLDNQLKTAIANFN